ncbi:unnamed protein product [Periconia digitata]|uniref:Uncharacterized protein n=1 Tax=Periconia digitata TaxID=1303443 RepID=A0A9W4XRY3_9PLEO|nr:unnamed protein product [Periconia digitata]
MQEMRHKGPTFKHCKSVISTKKRLDRWYTTTISIHRPHRDIPPRAIYPNDISVPGNHSHELTPRGTLINFSSLASNSVHSSCLT